MTPVLLDLFALLVLPKVLVARLSLCRGYGLCGIVIEAAGTFVAVAVVVTVHMGDDVVDFVLVTNAVDAVVSVSVAVCMHVFDRGWCSLSCPCC